MPKPTLIISIDHREKRSLKKVLDQPKFKKLKSQIKWDHLHSGDVRIIHKDINDNMKTLVAIERKTADDLLKSIDDGRFVEQKQRLLKEECVHVLYLIENQPSNYFKKKFLKRGTAAINVERVANDMMRDDGLLVLRTENTQRTLRELEKWIEKLSKEIQGGADDSKSEKEDSPVIPLMGFKKETLTPQGLLRSALTAIPGVRHALAKTLASEYKSMNNFLLSATADTLQGTEYSCQNKKCRLGEVVAKRIEQMFDL